MVIKKAKDPGYYSNIRHEIVAEVPEGVERILEIGCGLGLTGKAVKETRGAKEVIGIECEAKIAREAAANLDRVICADVDNYEFDFPDGYFDAIIMGDVIEHIRDPWAALARLSACLKNDGLLILTFPNIGYWRISYDLIIRNLFNYSSSGILDSTHLRFFTSRTMTRYLEGMNYQVIKIVPTLKLSTKARLANIITFNKFKHLFIWQYLVVARKAAN